LNYDHALYDIFGFSDWPFSNISRRQICADGDIFSFIQFILWRNTYLLPQKSTSISI